MKKLQHFLTLFLLCVFVFTSCQKDKAEIKDESTKNEVAKITRQLQIFKQNLQLKSGETLPADSAEWYLEGLLNYEQANNTHEFIQIEFLYDTLVWPASNGDISYEGLQQLYALVNELTQAVVQQNGNPDYTFNVIDLQLIEPEHKSSGKQLIVALSGGLPGTTPTYIGFATDDYWTSGGLQGKCDMYEGQCIGRDATTELEYHFTFAETIPGYYVSVSTVSAHAIDYETDDNPYGYYMMWVENENHSNNCLSPGELNYYLSKWDYIKNINKPANKTFITVNVINNCIVGSGNNFYTYELKYGVNIGSNPN